MKFLWFSINLQNGQSPDQLNWSAWGGKKEGKGRPERKENFSSSQKDPHTGLAMSTEIFDIFKNVLSKYLTAS